MDLGSYLRTAREARSLSIDDVAAATKIKPALLSDLENNDLSRWPQPRVYRHGYLTAYARAVRLAPEEVLARFDDQFGSGPPVAFSPPVEKPQRSGFQRGREAILVAAGAAVLLAVGFNLFQFVSGNDAAAEP